MKDELVAEVMQQMLPYLDNAQLKQLRQVMEHTLFHYDISDSTAKPEEDGSGVLVASFIAAKRIDMLASTGMRVGEMVLLNRDDIDFAERECVVFGKGDKERVVYFDARAKLHLQEYLNSRTDDNPALFVTLRSPHERIRIGGIEHRLREMGKRLNIPKVHPHKFRRTLVTMAIDKGGMPIEQLQRLLGHQRIDTTLQYAMVKQSNVKTAHRKYIG